MNEKIINNLYEFWEKIGKLSNKLYKTDNYSSITMDNSDWPNRIFNLKNKKNTLEEIVNLSQKGKISEMIAITEPIYLDKNHKFEFILSQRNMALDLKSKKNVLYVNSNIKEVKTKRDSIDFAQTASEAFGYRVDFNLIYNIVKNLKMVRLFIYKENNKSLGCGSVFFDSNNNAGLHMIGTISKGRGKGIGKSMTERLIVEARNNNMNFCVLHASFMGESIYKKLGFKSYNEIITYKIQKNIF